mmetsp:Transcript_6396/g.22521  ORF Transcript_6396/g.22521 Transcript_6396/m.22521 type:complete len:236 (+) Transcript_6396:912-1619(+)
MHDVAPREQGAPRDDLSEDAPDGPHVNRRRVVGEEAPTQLRRAVPPRGNIVRPEYVGRARVCERRPGQPEVAELELAVRVGQDVLRLQVAVIHRRPVHVLQPPQHLVQEELVVLRRQVVVRLYHLVQVRLHQLEHHVQVIVPVRVGREHDVLDLHDVGVLEQPHELHLAQDPRRVGDVVEDLLDLLDGNLLARLAVGGAAHDAIAALADDVVDLVAVGLAVGAEEVSLLRHPLLV